MAVLSIILGILLVIGGFSCMFTPVLTFMSTGFFIIILFFVYGLFGIIRGISEKRYNLDFFFSILSLIAGIIGFVFPGAAAMENNMMLLFMAAFWFIVKGILDIILTLNINKVVHNTAATVIGVLLGILSILLGFYSFAHPFVLAIALGFLIGLYFVESGISMILFSTIRSGE